MANGHPFSKFKIHHGVKAKQNELCGYISVSAFASYIPCNSEHYWLWWINQCKAKSPNCYSACDLNFCKIARKVIQVQHNLESSTYAKP